MRVSKPCVQLLFTALLVTSLVTLASPAHAGQRPYRPDASLKLCGWGDTCNNAPPHRYFGNNIYNTTGSGQIVSSGLEEGNDIRFWLKLENDGTSDDTVYVKGCTGNSGFVLRAVLVGAYTQSTNADNVTGPFKRGTAHFDLQANGASSVVLTVDLWARTQTHGATYTCPITIWSGTQPSFKDTVVAKLVTCYRNCLRLDVPVTRNQHGAENARSRPTSASP